MSQGLINSIPLAWSKSLLNITGRSNILRNSGSLRVKAAGEICNDCCWPSECYFIVSIFSVANKESVILLVYLLHTRSYITIYQSFCMFHLKFDWVLYLLHQRWPEPASSSTNRNQCSTELPLLQSWVQNSKLQWVLHLTMSL